MVAGGDEGNGQDPCSPRHPVRVVPLLVLAVLLAGCTTAPIPPKRAERLDAWPAWEVGDTWTWHVRSRGTDSTYVEGEVSGTVLAVDEETYLLYTEDNRGVGANQTFWRSNMSLSTARTDNFRLPLHVGANWTSAGQAFRVTGLERVHTPAGEFWAWKINGTEIAAKPAGWRDDWWSPEAKIWVKSRQTRLAGNGYVGIERELQEYRLASGGSSP